MGLESPGCPNPRCPRSWGSQTTGKWCRTDNLVASWVDVICVDDSNIDGTLSDALGDAIGAYNDQDLSFSLTRGSGGDCDATIAVYTMAGSGGQAGFPTGGRPYHQFELGTDLAGNRTIAKHVIMHELGHCIGFRHTDYYDRSISCGGDSVDEGWAGIGANHIPGTPTDAQLDGSVMNSCYNGGSNGEWTDADIIALQELYGDDGGDGDGGGEPSAIAVEGSYVREPWENDWHGVEIYSEGDQLWWKNDAGVQWTLSLGSDGELWTGDDCAYGVQRINLVFDGDRVQELWFQDEMYRRQ